MIVIPVRKVPTIFVIHSQYKKYLQYVFFRCLFFEKRRSLLGAEKSFFYLGPANCLRRSGIHSSIPVNPFGKNNIRPEGMPLCGIRVEARKKMSLKLHQTDEAFFISSIQHPVSSNQQFLIFLSQLCPPPLPLPKRSVSGQPLLLLSAASLVRGFS